MKWTRDPSRAAGMPDAVMDVILELYQEIFRIAKDLGLDLYYLSRQWGELGEGSSMALSRAHFDSLILEADRTLDPKRYFLQHEGSDAFWPGPQARLRRHGSVMEDPVHQDLAVHQGIYINIYPLDVFPKWTLAQHNLLSSYRSIQTAIMDNELDDESNWKRNLEKRKKLIRSGDLEDVSWFIVYPMVAGDVNHCIIGKNDLLDVSLLTYPAEADYREWFFDVPEDI